MQVWVGSLWTELRAWARPSTSTRLEARTHAPWASTTTRLCALEWSREMMMLTANWFLRSVHMRMLKAEDHGTAVEVVRVCDRDWAW